MSRLRIEIDRLEVSVPDWPAAADAAVLDGLDAELRARLEQIRWGGSIAGLLEIAELSIAGSALPADPAALRAAIADALATAVSGRWV